jgi:hypothetical protein
MVLHIRLGADASSLQGYGPQGLGLVRVTDIPESQQLTRRILRQAKELAVSDGYLTHCRYSCTHPAQEWELLFCTLQSLPKDAADKLRDPQHGYAIGLSSGDETGQQGSQLVSFYATPFLTRPDRQRQLMYPKLWTPTICKSFRTDVYHAGSQGQTSQHQHAYVCL